MKREPHPIAKELRKIRRSREIYTYDLAALMGYDRNTISAWENGLRWPGRQALSDWCDALKVELRVHDLS